MGDRDWGKMQLRNAASEWRAGFGQSFRGCRTKQAGLGMLHAAPLVEEPVLPHSVQPGLKFITGIT